MEFRTPIILLSLLIVPLLLTPAGANATMAEDPSLGIEVQLSAPTIELSGINTSVLLTITNRKQPRRLEVDAQVEPLSLTQRIPTATSRLIQALPVGTTQLEVPLSRCSISDRINIRFRIDGRRVPKLETGLNVGHRARTGAAVLIGDSGIDLYAATGITTASMLPIIAIPPSEASRYWQSYLGLSGFVVLSTEAESVLSPAQRTALSRWVKYGGGSLVLYGPEGHRAARALGMPVPEDTSALGFMTGSLFLFDGSRSPKMDHELRYILQRAGPLEAVLHKAFELPDADPAENAEEIPFFSQTPPNISGSNATVFFQDLHTIPRLGFGILSVFFALLIGPVNYFLLLRKRRLALFFVTAPVLAFSSLVVLALYAFLSQGIGIKLNERVLLLHNLETDEGAVYHLRGLYAGLAPSGVTFATDTAVAPLLDDSYLTRSGDLVTNWSTAQALESGWIRSREYSGLATITPIRVRMDVRVETDPDGTVWVNNRLTSSISAVLARLDDPENGGKMYYEASDVAPGQRVEMKRNDFNSDLAQYTGQLLFDVTPLDWRVLAQTEGLPHIEEGGISGNVVEGSYVYLAVRPLSEGNESDE